MSAFGTFYNPGGAGTGYADMTKSQEDDIFHLGAKVTQFKQKWSKYTAHNTSMILQPVQNQGLGNNMISNLIKTPDFLFSSYICQFYPGIKANQDAGIVDCSWVNAPALYAIRSIALKIGSQTMFQMNGQAMMVLLELYGKLAQYAKLVGLCKTKQQLIANSKVDQRFYAPLIGFPFQDRPDLAFGVGAIAFHGVTIEIYSRQLSEMYVNYGGVSQKNGVYGLPYQISSNAPIQPNSVQFHLATNCVWVSPEERVGLIHGYNESIFRECLTAGEFTVQPSATPQRVAFDLNIKGPCIYIAVTIQARSDLEQGNWTKLCQDSGEDWISEMMLITGSTPREDGLPAEFYRTGKVIEAFKNKIDRHIYVISFETDAHSRQMTGHQSMTNVEKLQFSALYKPHASPLEVSVISQVYNGWYLEKGTGGKIWN